MKISVNLARRPYVELGPVYNRLRTWMAILAVLGLALWFLYRGERTQAEEKLAYVHGVEHHVQQLEQQQQSYQALMVQPKDAAILRQSDYLNDLFRRKAFSWTATMTDLETVLPGGVQVLSIDPIVAKDGHVTIRLRVTGSRDRALELVRNLEKSKHFALPRLAAEQQATAPTGPGTFQNANASSDVNFDILADYVPLPLPVDAQSEEEKPAEAETHASAPAAKKPGVTKAPRTKTAGRKKMPGSASAAGRTGGRTGGRTAGPTAGRTAGPTAHGASARALPAPPPPRRTPQP
ncbi:MAG TPA: PilN domain-containing protein [Acidobacteriaceae bacterium]|nr:PilN domain-containing protein [Acidobacteriaceae bacterium]